MTVLREPSAREERQIAQRAAHLHALLQAGREVGLTGYPDYGWDTTMPAEPCLILAGVHVHAHGTEQPEFVIGDHQQRISVTRIDLALRTIRALAATNTPHTSEPTT